MRLSTHHQSSGAAKSLPANCRESWSSVVARHRRTAQPGSGGPSFSGQRTLGCRSSAAVAGRSRICAGLHLGCWFFGALEFRLRRAAHFSAGCPSFGGQRTLGCRSSTAVAGRSHSCAMSRQGCALIGALEFRPRRPKHFRVGCPSYGGQRTGGCRSSATVAGRSHTCAAWQRRIRVQGRRVLALSPRSDRPNPSFEPTATGKPASAAQLKRWAYMKQFVALLIALVAWPAAAVEEWQWVKAINNVSTGWGTETGMANVHIKGASFEAELFWGPAKTDGVRITLKGTIAKNKVTAIEAVLDTDMEPTKYTGKYAKHIWKKPFEGTVGTEAITLSDGYNMIGLRRNMAK